MLKHRIWLKLSASFYIIITYGIFFQWQSSHYHHIITLKLHKEAFHFLRNLLWNFHTILYSEWLIAMFNQVLDQRLFLRFHDLWWFWLIIIWFDCFSALLTSWYFVELNEITPNENCLSWNPFETRVSELHYCNYTYQITFTWNMTGDAGGEGHVYISGSPDVSLAFL